jgi:hypothetical protein
VIAVVLFFAAVAGIALAIRALYRRVPVRRLDPGHELDVLLADLRSLLDRRLVEDHGRAALIVREFARALGVADDLRRRVEVALDRLETANLQAGRVPVEESGETALDSERLR